MIGMINLFPDAAAFIGVIGDIVNGLISGNYIGRFLVLVFTVLCTVKLVGKLTYRESGG